MTNPLLPRRPRLRVPIRIQPSRIDTQMDRVASGQTLRHPANPRCAYEYRVRPCSAGSRIRHGVGGLDRQRAILKAEAGISGTFTDGRDDKFQGLSQIGAGDLKFIGRLRRRHHNGDPVWNVFGIAPSLNCPWRGERSSSKSIRISHLRFSIAPGLHPIAPFFWDWEQSKIPSSPSASVRCE